MGAENDGLHAFSVGPLIAFREGKLPNRAVPFLEALIAGEGLGVGEIGLELCKGEDELLRNGQRFGALRKNSIGTARQGGYSLEPGITRG